MKRRLILSTAIAITIGFFVMGTARWYQSTQKITLPFKTETPQIRTIVESLDAIGILRIKGNMKVGSLVAGTITEVVVKENQLVEADQTLAIVEDGLKDSNIKIAKAHLEKSHARLQYQKSHFERIKALYERGQLADDKYEEERCLLGQVEAEHAYSHEVHEKEKLLYQNKWIKAPAQGIVYDISIAKGERITTDLNATVICKIAPDLSKMVAELELDENDISKAKENLDVKITVDSLHNHTFGGKLESVSYSAVTKNNSTFYRGTVSLDDCKDLLRPDMIAHASIEIARADSALSISSNTLSINPDSIKNVAQKLKYSFNPLSDETRKQLKTPPASSGTALYKTVWVVNGPSFVERMVTLGATNEMYYAIVEGLSADDKVVIDVDEVNQMEDLYKKMFKKSSL